MFARRRIVFFLYEKNYSQEKIDRLLYYASLSTIQEGYITYFIISKNLIKKNHDLEQKLKKTNLNIFYASNVPRIFQTKYLKKLIMNLSLKLSIDTIVTLSNNNVFKDKSIKSKIPIIYLKSLQDNVALLLNNFYFIISNTDDTYINDKISIFHHSYSLEFNAIENAKWAENADISFPKDKNCFYIGVIDDQITIPHIEMILNALSQIIQDQLSIKCLMMIPSYHMKHVRQVAFDYGIAQNVFLINPDNTSKTVVEILDSVDVTVHMSNKPFSEKYIFQSWEYFVPVIALIDGHYSKIIVDGDNGLLVNNAKDITIAIKKIMTNTNLHSSLGYYGNRDLHERFNREVAKKNLLNIFDRVYTMFYYNR